MVGLWLRRGFVLIGTLVSLVMVGIRFLSFLRLACFNFVFLWGGELVVFFGKGRCVFLKGK